MLHRVAQLALASALVACAACGGASLPPLGARARVVPKPLSAPTSCEAGPQQEQEEEPEGREPRALTDLERRMRDSLVLPNGEPDLEACRAVCRRALRPGDDVVSCFLVTSQERLVCEGSKCLGHEADALARSLFCGEPGRRAGADPVAAQARLPFLGRQGEEVIVCSLR